MNTCSPDDRPRLAICLEYPIDFQGGVSVLCKILARELATRYRVILVSDDDDQSIARSDLAPFIEQHVRWVSSEVSPRRSRELADWLVAAGVQIAHFHFGGNYGWGSRMIGCGPLPRVARRGITVFSTVHLVVDLLDGFCGPQKPLWFKLALLPGAWVGKMHLLKSVRAEIVVSRWGAARLRKWYWPLRDRIQTIYHSRVRTSELAPLNYSREKLILNIGHIAARKGQHILAEAFARVADRHPEWKLLLLGDVLEEKCGAEIRRIAQCGSLQQRIEMPGPRPDALNFMRRAAIFVQPSFFEGLPLALQEAMLSGCACIGTNISGNSELISHEENGLLVPKADSAALAEALDRLMSSEPLCHALQDRARASTLDKGMSAEQMIQAHVELYERFLRAS